MAQAQAQTNTPTKHFEDQYDDEAVLYVFRRHPIVMRKGLVFGMLGPLLGIMPAFAGTLPPLAGSAIGSLSVFFGGLGAGCVLGLLIFGISWVPWYFSVFIVTDQRFIQISQKGFFHRSVTDITLAQIQLINYEVAGIEQTLLGFGTIVVQTYVGDLVIHDIHHPAKTARKLQLILRDQGVVPVAPIAGNEQDA